MMPQRVPKSFCPYQKGLNAKKKVLNKFIEFANKKVVLVSVPGACTGTCSKKHLPGYLANLSRFKEKGVDKIAVIAYNDAYVMSAWGKAHGVQSEDVVSILFQLSKNGCPSEAVD